MAYANGHLPHSALTRITDAVNGEHCYLAHDAARAFLAMNAESEQRFGVTLRASSARVAYRPYSAQVYFWNQYRYHGGNLAAYPGTSNHGLGLAVDFATEEMRHIVDKIGAKYGWAKKWSDAPTEWWHIKWRPGNYSEAIRWAGYTAAEKRVIKRLDSKAGLPLRRHDRKWAHDRAVELRHAARDHHGWDYAARRARYHSLVARGRA